MISLICFQILYSGLEPTGSPTIIVPLLSIFIINLFRFSMLSSQESPIYSYLLTYRSANSFADALGVDSEALGLGVCHADDLYHIFKVHHLALFLLGGVNSTPLPVVL